MVLADNFETFIADILSSSFTITKYSTFRNSLRTQIVISITVSIYHSLQKIKNLMTKYLSDRLASLKLIIN